MIDRMKVRGNERSGLTPESIELVLTVEPQRMNELAQAIARDDLQVVRQVSHRMRGAFHRLALPAHAAASRRLEQAASEGDLDEARSRFLELDELFFGLVASLEGGGQAGMTVETVETLERLEPLE